MKLSQEEFEKLAMEQLDLLYRTARRFTRNTDRAADLVQETFLRLRSRETFDLKEHGIRPWLVRIMRNLHLSRAERESHQPRATDGDSLDAHHDGHHGAAPLASDRFQNMDEELVQALHKLPEEYQAVLMLWAVEDFSYKEIAHAIDAPIGTVMSRLHRARQLLLKSLDEFGKERRLIRE